MFIYMLPMNNYLISKASNEEIIEKYIIFPSISEKLLNVIIIFNNKNT